MILNILKSKAKGQTGIIIYYTYDIQSINLLHT